MINKPVDAIISCKSTSRPEEKNYHTCGCGNAHGRVRVDDHVSDRDAAEVEKIFH